VIAQIVSPVGLDPLLLPLLMLSSPALAPFPSQPTASTSTLPTAKHKPFYKNWDGITESILSSEKQITSNEDPNAGGDSSVNKFFQEIYSNASDDTKRAMMKSYVESGGTTLSTNWDEVGQGNVEVKPPQGSEWKKWAA
jgi:suppressor of G2 allele of SKP1